MTTTKSKVLKIPLKEMVSEHKRIVPELKRVGLKQEYKEQSREL